ncbi:MAG: MazG nucleotide pyrophosphohydrolase domain-containing protein [Candidatus Heimdallarchaeota archaeon]
MTDFEIICQKVDELINSLGGYWSKEWLIEPVIEELGEFSKELQISAGLHPGKTTSSKKLMEEYGDLLFAVIALGRGLNIEIEESLLNTISKYKNRRK